MGHWPTSMLRAAYAGCRSCVRTSSSIPISCMRLCVAGADAVLLIVAALEQEELASLHDRALGLGLDVLVEVHDRDELARAEQVGARLIGVNNRDLRDFSVDVGRTELLLAEMPAGTTVVSESGISKPQQLEQLERAGVAAVLVGESLMRALEPEQALAALLEGLPRGQSSSLRLRCVVRCCSQLTAAPKRSCRCWRIRSRTSGVRSFIKSHGPL